MFFLSCKSNASVQLAKTGEGPALFQNFCVVLFIVSLVSFCVLCVCVCVCVNVYCTTATGWLPNCSFYVMCAVLLPPGDKPIAFQQIYQYHISYV